MDFNNKIVEEAKTWIGTPYVHRSITKNGCDCTGLLLGIMRSLGFLLDYKLRKYPVDWNLHDMADDYIVKELAKFAKPVLKSQTKPGDILVFRWGKCESHVGIKITDHLFIHSKRGSSCKYSSLKRQEHLKRFSSAFRFDEDLLKGSC